MMRSAALGRNQTKPHLALFHAGGSLPKWVCMGPIFPYSYAIDFV
jgi:hypothetical protein